MLKLKNMRAKDHTNYLYDLALTELPRGSIVNIDRHHYGYEIHIVVLHESFDFTIESLDKHVAKNFLLQYCEVINDLHKKGLEKA